MRDALDLDATLEDFISPGSEWIEIGSQRKHVKSYLGDFLFSPARAHSPVRSLQRRRAQPPAAGAPVRAAGQRAGARRADQRPRHRHAGAARRPAAELRRHGVPGQPRPHLPRQRGDQHHRLRRRRPLARVRRQRAGLADPVEARARDRRAAQLPRLRPRPCARASSARARRSCSARGVAQEAQLQGAARARGAAGADRGAGRRAEAHHRDARTRRRRHLRQRCVARGGARRAPCADRRRTAGRARTLGRTRARLRQA